MNVSIGRGQRQGQAHQGAIHRGNYPEGKPVETALQWRTAGGQSGAVLAGGRRDQGQREQEVARRLPPAAALRQEVQLRLPEAQERQGGHLARLRQAEESGGQEEGRVGQGPQVSRNALSLHSLRQDRKVSIYV